MLGAFTGRMNVSEPSGDGKGAPAAGPRWTLLAGQDVAEGIRDADPSLGGGLGAEVNLRRIKRIWKS